MAPIVAATLRGWSKPRIRGAIPRADFTYGMNNQVNPGQRASKMSVHRGVLVLSERPLWLASL